MIFTPLLFALTGFALGRPTMALFASFGSFCLMAMTDLGGPLRRRFVGTLVITALCAGLIALGTVLAHWIVLAAVGMGIVAFLVRFAGLFGGYAVASGPALTLAFVLAVALPTTDSPLPDRLVGLDRGRRRRRARQRPALAGPRAPGHQRRAGERRARRSPTCSRSWRGTPRDPASVRSPTAPTTS